MERREKNRERNMGLLPVLHKQSLGAVGLGRRAVQSSAWVGALPHLSSPLPAPNLPLTFQALHAQPGASQNP